MPSVWLETVFADDYAVQVESALVHAVDKLRGIAFTRSPTWPIQRTRSRSRRRLFDSDKPFDGDLLGRAELAEQLTEQFARFPDDGVLAIDGGLGAGKTWFGRNWHAALIKKGYRAGYIDAFEADFVEDPFSSAVTR